MTWNEYQQWETETRAEITETAQRSHVSAGGGVSIDEGRVTVRRRDVIPETTGRNYATYSLFTWTGNNYGDLASAEETRLPAFIGGQITNLDYISPTFATNQAELKLTLQFLGQTLVGKTSRVFRYSFPVQVTLVQYVSGQLGGTDEDFYRQDPVRTVVLDLKRDPVTVQFYRDPNDYKTNIVRLVSLTKT
jgi:hypothetical protein